MTEAVERERDYLDAQVELLLSIEDDFDFDTALTSMSAMQVGIFAPLDDGYRPVASASQVTRENLWSLAAERRMMDHQVPPYNEFEQIRDDIAGLGDDEFES